MIEKICPFCKEIFDEDLIKDHIGINHLGLHNNTEPNQVRNQFSVKRSFACNECEEKFDRESDLKIHQNVVHPSFKFSCGKCEVRFLSESSLNLHTK